MIEIVGLENGQNGPTCGIHPYCGEQVIPGTVLKLVRNEITIVETVEVERVVPTYQSPTTKARGRPKKKPMEKIKILQSKTESVLEARLWKNNVCSCLVGFVSKPFVAVYGCLLEGRVVKVRDLDKLSEYETVRQRSREHNGLAIGVIIG